MPRPRFAKLPAERRAAILRAAAIEFAECGYEGASYNRIIDHAGLSKGAVYYYFDDKEDLYATVLRDAVQRLLLDTGNMSLAVDASSFWFEFEAWYVKSLTAFQKDPHAVGLARSLLKVMQRGVAGGVVAELKRFARAWMDDLIDSGQAVRAIRKDLPKELLASVLTGLEEGIDTWLGEHIGTIRPREIQKYAAMLTRLYRDVAEPKPKHKSKPKQKPKQKRGRS